MRGEALQMSDSRGHTLAAEAVERPDEQNVELAPRGVGEHRCELLSVLDALAAILVLNVFTDERVAHTLAPCTQLQELVLRVLPLIVRRHPGINGNRANTICSSSCNPICNSLRHETFLLYLFGTSTIMDEISIG